MDNKLEQRSFYLLLVSVTVLFLWLLKPFFGAVFWACTIALLFYPLHRRLLARWGDRPNLVALVSLTACVFIGVVPVLFVVGSFFQEGVNLYQRLESGELDPDAWIDRIRQTFPMIQNVLEGLGVDITNLREQLAGGAITASRFIAQNAVQVGQGTARFLFHLSLMLYLAFFMLRDGPRLVEKLMQALPLDDERERLLFDKFAEVTRATVKGNLVVAAVQGTLGGLIFWALGITGAFLWGVVMTLLSLIPVVGAGLIWLPVAIYLLATGEWLDGLILIVYGAGVIGLVDNILRPILVGRDTKLPDYIVLLSTLGGFVLFGMNGFVIGPLVAAMFVTFWDIFVREFQ
ncbi:AI-2E family transporter [Kineobactrum sediminis]|uniref:AI-2E family transporter n=1 Tax=Kineobactrum sediminis TaxID=1905677 RepID=A0A2N5XYR9_9GAMM|nr:AI-2E family transporter [Kineobactrum sediminis]PLW81285.1 AI-2E family transporter [Kineobactrum sediminis]